MADLGFGVLARQPAGEVQQAAEVAGEEEEGLRGLDAGSFVVGHFGRDIGVFYAEGAPEAAAEVWFGHFGQSEAGDGGEQLAGLGFNS